MSSRTTIFFAALLAGFALLSTAACSDDPDIGDADFAYVSANPPSPPLISIQGGSLDEADWPLAQPPRPDQADIHPYFSPDGQYIAYERRVFDDGAEVGELHRVSVDGQQQRRLTDIGRHQRCELAPRGWDPDSQVVAFVCLPTDGDEPRRVGTVTVDNSAVLLDTDSPDLEYTDIRFLPDGALVVLSHDTDSGLRALHRIGHEQTGDITESIATFDADGLVDGLRISPDGSRAAMLQATDSDAAPVRPRASIIVVDLDSGDTHSLLADDDGPTSTGHHSVQTWHPDGERLLVATGGYGADAGPLRLIDADDDTNQTTLVEANDLTNGTIRRADISADGELVIFSDNDSDTDDPRRWTTGTLNLVNTDGTGFRTLDALSVPDQVNQPTFNPTAF